MSFQHIHQGSPILTTGVPLDEAKAAMVMVHGRGATAESILTLSSEFNAESFAYVAPQAAGNAWYPYSFLSPIAQNEPGISSGIRLIGEVIEHIENAGIPGERIIILGFSQGACLSTEFAARNARRYGGIIGLSGGLIGPDDAPRDYEGSLENTPVFLGCSDIDPHIPLQRVNHSTEVLRGLGAEVTEQIYPGMAHTVNQDEIDFIRELMAEISKK